RQIFLDERVFGGGVRFGVLLVVALPEFLRHHAGGHRRGGLRGGFHGGCGQSAHTLAVVLVSEAWARARRCCSSAAVRPVNHIWPHQRARIPPTRAVTQACQKSVEPVQSPARLLPAPRRNPAIAPSIIIDFMLETPV